MINANNFPKDPLIQTCLDIEALEVRNTTEDHVVEIKEKKKKLVNLCAEYSNKEQFKGERPQDTLRNMSQYFLDAASSLAEVKTTIAVVTKVMNDNKVLNFGPMSPIHQAVVVTSISFTVYHEKKKLASEQAAKEAAANEAAVAQAKAAAAQAAQANAVPVAIAPGSPYPFLPATPHASAIHVNDDDTESTAAATAGSVVTDSAHSSSSSHSSVEVLVKNKNKKEEEEKAAAAEFQRTQQARQNLKQLASDKAEAQNKLDKEMQALIKQAWIVPKGAAWGAVGGAALSMISLIIVLEMQGNNAAAFIWEGLLNGKDVKNGHVTDAHATLGALMFFVGLGVGAGIGALTAKVSKLPLETKKTMLKGAVCASAISLVCLGLVILTGYEGRDHHFHNGLKGMVDSIWGLLGHGHYIGEHQHTASHTREAFSIFGAVLAVGSSMIGAGAGAKKGVKKEMLPMR